MVMPFLCEREWRDSIAIPVLRQRFQHRDVVSAAIRGGCRQREANNGFPVSGPDQDDGFLLCGDQEALDPDLRRRIAMALQRLEQMRQAAFQGGEPWRCG
ncbi:MAG: hypothetical protein U5K33_06665 [Halofilum sp. (in: g-proteobacteria)]|nr:hypothetical protein [Halofilum sp. (in: g-proteobacteria)]